MMAMIRELEDRREALVMRCAMQRTLLSAHIAPTARKLAVVDRVATTVRAHPVVMGVALTGLALLGGRMLFRWPVLVAPLYGLLTRL